MQPRLVRALTSGTARRDRSFRFRFADLVLADFNLFAWAGAIGLKLWHSNLTSRLFETRTRSAEMPGIWLG